MLSKARKNFHKIQWKLIFIFILLILSVMIIAGTFLLSSVSSFYHNQFKEKMNMEFNDSLKKSITLALKTEEPVANLKELMDAFAPARLGVGANRNYYILDGNSGECITGSSDNSDVMLTNNIVSAIAGDVGDVISVKSTFMDFAYPVENDGIKYIIYVKDNKTEVNEISHSLFMVVMQAVLYGALIAIVIGYFMSKTITVPIRNLTGKASKMAEGNFDSVIEVRGDDEIGVLTTTFNIMASKLKNTLDEISSEKDKIEVIIKNLDDGIVAFDLNGKTIHINPSAEKMLGVEKNELSDFETFCGKIGVEVSMDDIITNKEETRKEWELEFNDMIISAHFAPYRTDFNKTEGVVAVLQDITKQQKLDRSRRAFVADVSHELRTPLTNIKSYSETLLDAEIEDKEISKNFLGVINSEADRMTRLVTDLLVLSRLEHTEDALKLAPCDVQSLVGQIVETMSISAQKSKLTLTYVKGTEAENIMVDRDKINQVVVNIISNAIKYTPEGGTISVLCGSRENSLYISVSDTGMGIPEKDLPMIFDRFYRVDKARSRKQGGTGLGLAIAKEIVEAHKGSISIDSEYGKGTTVTVNLPTNINESEGE